jgi:hypothetical protein
MESAAWFVRWRGGLRCTPEMRQGALCRAFGLVGAGVWCMEEAPGFVGLAAGKPQIYPL